MGEELSAADRVAIEHEAIRYCRIQGVHWPPEGRDWQHALAVAAFTAGYRKGLTEATHPAAADD